MSFFRRHERSVPSAIPGLEIGHRGDATHDAPKKGLKEGFHVDHHPVGVCVLLQREIRARTLDIDETRRFARELRIQCPGTTLRSACCPTAAGTGNPASAARD